MQKMPWLIFRKTVEQYFFVSCDSLIILTIQFTGNNSWMILTKSKLVIWHNQCQGLVSVFSTTVFSINLRVIYWNNLFLLFWLAITGMGYSGNYEFLFLHLLKFSNKRVKCFSEMISEDCCFFFICSCIFY